MLVQNMMKYVLNTNNQWRKLLTISRLGGKAKLLFSLSEPWVGSVLDIPQNKVSLVNRSP